MPCTGRYAEAQAFADFWCIGYALSAEEQATIETFLDLTAADIHAALAAAGMCDCTMAAWAADFLAKLQIIDAAAYYNCPCANPKLTPEARVALIDWMNLQFDNIRTMKIDLCAGHTGAEYPVIGWAEQARTEFGQAEIIYNAILREGS